MKLKHIPLLLLVLTCCPACQNKKASATKEIPSEATYTNPLLAVGAMGCLSRRQILLHTRSRE